MKLPTIRQYEKALIHGLTEPQREILQLLIAFPQSTATAKELTVALGNLPDYHVIASSRVGNAGRAIANYLNFETSHYPDGRKLKPYTLIGEYYKSDNAGKRAGWRMNSNLRVAILNVGLYKESNKSGQTTYLTTEEIPSSLNKDYLEGKLIKVFVNKYERNARARIACIKHYGCFCQVCGFDFKKIFGKLAEGYIQVHHRMPLSEIKKSYKVDPVNDLIPLCANCHAAIHLEKPAMKENSLKRIIDKNKK